MYKKALFLISLVLMLGLTSQVFSADVLWTNGAGNRQWSTTGNWNLNRVPTSASIDDAIIVKTGVNGPIFDTIDGTRSAWFIPVGQDGSNGELWIQGGTLNAPWGMAFNKGSDAYSNSTVHMSGGTLNLTGSTIGGEILQVGRAGTATFNLTGGTVECVSLEIPSGGGVGRTGIFNLDGGEISTTNMIIGPLPSILNITEGKLILDGDKQALVNGYIGANKIVPYPGESGRKVVNVDYDNLNEGETTVTASLLTMEQAWGPEPIDTHPEVNLDAILSWAPGDGVISHDVYFGTDFNDVNDALDPNALPGRGRQDSNSFDYGGFAYGTLYFWRIDEFDGVDVEKGVIWSFTSTDLNPAAASEPYPDDETEDVGTDLVLEWAAGIGTISHEVYIGTNYSDVYNSTTPTATTDVNYWAPGDIIETDKTYHWRIDEWDGSQRYTGRMWEFTVGSLDARLASNPNPVSGERNVQTNKTLNWTPGYGAISHDVYFGTNSSEVTSATDPNALPGRGRQDANSYDPGGLEQDQTYWWRIDEYNGNVTRKGQVWNFGAAGMVAFPKAEGYGAYSKGGRGGDVYHVTSLADYNDSEPNIPGSLRWGIESATGARTIVFDISGYISLKSRLEFGNDYLTIAGQTAPGDGVTIRHWDLRLYQASNVIIRYIRVRTGRFADQLPILNLPASDPNHLHGGLDCLSIEGSIDIIIDHCSMSWSSDEIGSVTGDSTDATVQWCFFTEPLNWDGSHAYASLMRPAIGGRFTHHHNLYCDIQQRVTRFGDYNYNEDVRYDWYNNIVYNWGSGSYGSTYSANNNILWDYETREAGDPCTADAGELVNLNFMKNYFIAGADTSFAYAYNGGSSTNSKIWAESNFWDYDKEPNDHDGEDGGWGIITGGHNPMLQAFEIAAPVTMDDAETAYDKVLAESGASLVRDTTDARIVSEVSSRTGNILIDQNDLPEEPYPVITEVSRPAGFDTDGDGMPNLWEISRRLDPDDASDRNDDRTGDGYTNLEEYLNYLVHKSGTIAGDLDDDGDVDMYDLFYMTNNWLVDDCTYVPTGNLDGDCNIDFRDFAAFMQNWTN